MPRRTRSLNTLLRSELPAALVASVLALCALPAQAGERRCAEDVHCDGGQVCRYGACRVPCTADGECNVQAGQTCILGACLLSHSLDFVQDWGADVGGASGPACLADADCFRAACTSGTEGCDPVRMECQGGTCVRPGVECAFQGHGFDASCPAGYRCNAAQNRCEGGACTTADDCTNASAYAGMRCLFGRCTADCATDADCCDAAGPERCPTSGAPRTCVNMAGFTGGLCAARTAGARLVAYQETADPEDAYNLVFVSEGFQAAAMDAFLENAFMFIEWQVTHADIIAPLFSEKVNIYVLALPDTATGYSQPTLFGYLPGPEQRTFDRPGSASAARFQAYIALRSLISSRRPSPMLDANVPQNIGVVNLFNVGGADETRAFSNLDNYVFMPVRPTPAPFDSMTGIYFVLSHELGHMLGKLGDEYQSDPELPGLTPRDCQPNIELRTSVTSPPCSACNDSAWLESEVAWADLINTHTFPTRSSSLEVIGLYEGGDARYDTEVVRAQRDCVMRQDGRQDFCSACRLALVSATHPPGGTRPFRYLDLSSPVLEPEQYGEGPNFAVGVNESGHRAYITRLSEGPDLTGDVPTLTRVDVDVLTEEGARDYELSDQLPSMDIPEAMVIDEARDRVFLFAPDADDSNQSRLVVFDGAGGHFLPPIVIPGLFGAPVIAPFAGGAGKLIAYRADLAVEAPQLAIVDLGAELVPRYVAPTQDPRGLPQLPAEPVYAPESRLVFFPTSPTPRSRPYCTSGRCEIWVFDPDTEQFRDDVILEITSSDSVEPSGVIEMAIGRQPTVDPNAAIPGELLIVTTQEKVYVWRTAAIAAGDPTPAAEWQHDLGTGSLVSAVAFDQASRSVVLGNRAGEVAFVQLDGTNAPTGERVEIPGREPAMEVRDILTADDATVFVAMAGFSGPRRGVLATLNLAPGVTTIGERVVSAQAIASMGLSSQQLALDRSRGILFSNTTVNTGDDMSFSSHTRFRMPLVSTLTVPTRVPRHCGGP